MEFGIKLAVYLAKKNIKYKDFAKIIQKHEGEISNYARGRIKKPKLVTALKIQGATKGYITLEDMGY